MATKYVVIENNSYPVDNDAQREAAKVAMAACEIDSTPVYLGDPEDSSSYASGDTFWGFGKELHRSGGATEMVAEFTRPIMH